jgi:hypothetical protein
MQANFEYARLNGAMRHLNHTHYLCSEALDGTLAVLSELVENGR